MSWKFWKPAHTVESVIHELADGLRDGSIVLDAESTEKQADDSINSILVLEIPTKSIRSNRQLFGRIRKWTARLNSAHRYRGGKGIRVCQFESKPEASVFLLGIQPIEKDDSIESIVAAIKHLQQKRPRLKIIRRDFVHRG